jgi:methionine-R-sulfoxide reductase
MQGYALFFATLLLFQGEKVIKSDAEWKDTLSPERYFVMRQKGTEPPFSSLPLQGEGPFLCAACALPLFLAEDLYSAGNGWPAFKNIAAKENIYYLEDWDLGFKRYEILCRGCDCHLGHVFHDGPPPKQLRYTVNGICLMTENNETRYKP